MGRCGCPAGRTRCRRRRPPPDPRGAARPARPDAGGHGRLADTALAQHPDLVVAAQRGGHHGLHRRLTLFLARGAGVHQPERRARRYRARQPWVGLGLAGRGGGGRQRGRGQPGGRGRRRRQHDARDPLRRRPSGIVRWRALPEAVAQVVVAVGHRVQYRWSREIDVFGGFHSRFLGRLSVSASKV